LKYFAPWLSWFGLRELFDTVHQYFKVDALNGPIITNRIEMAIDQNFYKDSNCSIALVAVVTTYGATTTA